MACDILDHFENLTIFDIFLLEIPEIGNTHAGETHKAKEVSCPCPLGRFKLKIQQGHQLFKGQIKMYSSRTSKKVWLVFLCFPAGLIMAFFR